MLINKNKIQSVEFIDAYTSGVKVGNNVGDLKQEEIDKRTDCFVKDGFVYQKPILFFKMEGLSSTHRKVFETKDDAASFYNCLKYDTVPKYDEIKFVGTTAIGNSIVGSEPLPLFIEVDD
jgi:hypothetical protein